MADEFVPGVGEKDCTDRAASIVTGKQIGRAHV